MLYCLNTGRVIGEFYLSDWNKLFFKKNPGIVIIKILFQDNGIVG